LHARWDDNRLNEWYERSTTALLLLIVIQRSIVPLVVLPMCDEVRNSVVVRENKMKTKKEKEKEKEEDTHEL